MEYDALMFWYMKMNTTILALTFLKSCLEQNLSNLKLALRHPTIVKKTEGYEFSKKPLL